ncbi:hypothetical protein AVEN_108647-1 [Araneus ventricosus]|uniref:Transposable element Tcb2 transposase n=1 Tax=Araneus ventricosus TaxID=182803 RepID=A0A4Y2IQP2_ARAVE|nr:hypothetical protein AVEN_108647-1 [Araneus ventricosus]
MTSRHHFPEELRWRAIGRLEAGQTQTEVARWLNVSPSVDHRLWQQFLITDSASRRFSQGRPIATTSADDRYLSRTKVYNRNSDSNHILPCSITGMLVSTPTVRRRLHEGSLYAKRPAIYGTITSRHRRECLNWAHQHVHWTPDQWRAVLFMGTIGDDFLLQDDNARTHIVNDYLQQETIQRMEWPARSPDLSPIEHVWDALGRRISAPNPPPQTLATLATDLPEQWHSLPTELIDRIIDSITLRCMCSIASRRDHTPY